MRIEKTCLRALAFSCVALSCAAAESCAATVETPPTQPPVAMSWASTSTGTVKKRSNVRNHATTASTATPLQTPAASGVAPTQANPTAQPPEAGNGQYPTDWMERSNVSNPFLRGFIDGMRDARNGEDVQESSAQRNAGRAISLAIAMFFGFCLFKIATKLGDPYPWLALIPYVQTYTFVKCGGKSGWWVLWLILGYIAVVIPWLILTIIVMHGISKRYWRGAGTTILMFLFPYVMFPVLALSEPEPGF